MRLRYYDPQAGRFVSRGPLGLWGDPSQSGNGQGYCGHDPVNGTDPLGLLEDVVVGTAADLLPGVKADMESLGMPTKWIDDLLKDNSKMEVFKRIPTQQDRRDGKGGAEFGGQHVGADNLMYPETAFETDPKTGKTRIRPLKDIFKVDPDLAGAIVEELFHAWIWTKGGCDDFGLEEKHEEILSSYVHILAMWWIRLHGQPADEIRRKWGVDEASTYPQDRPVAPGKTVTEEKPTARKDAFEGADPGRTVAGEDAAQNRMTKELQTKFQQMSDLGGLEGGPLKK